MSDRVSANNSLRSCPFCGSRAEIVEATERGPSAYVVRCTDSMCMSSSKVIFALKDDPEPLLIEMWNNRAGAVDNSYLVTALENALDRMIAENRRSEYGFDDEMAAAREALARAGKAISHAS